MDGKLSFILKFILFIIFVGMVIWGQRQVGYGNLAVMLAGLGGLLGMLYAYNRKYR